MLRVPKTRWVDWEAGFWLLPVTRGCYRLEEQWVVSLESHELLTRLQSYRRPLPESDIFEL